MLHTRKAHKSGEIIMFYSDHVLLFQFYLKHTCIYAGLENKQHSECVGSLVNNMSLKYWGSCTSFLEMEN